MVWREILAVLKASIKGAISLKPEKPLPPNLVSMHFTSTSTCTIFLSRFYFSTPMNYIYVVHVSKGNFVRFEWQMKKGQNLRNWRSHAHQIWFPCISGQPLLAKILWGNSIFWLPWTIYSPKGKFGQIWRQKMSQISKLKKPCASNLVLMHFT